MKQNVKCGATYIGQTGWSVEVRIREHFSRPREYKIGEHIEKIGYKRDDFTVKLLHRENSYGKRLILEHIEITKMMEKWKNDRSLI